MFVLASFHCGDCSLSFGACHYPEGKTHGPATRRPDMSSLVHPLDDKAQSRPSTSPESKNRKFVSCVKNVAKRLC